MFWDSSALVPCLVQEEASGRLRDFLLADNKIVIWWATPVECASALERKNREGLPRELYAKGYERLQDIVRLAQPVLPAEAIRILAIELLGRHRLRGLRAADALQLAAAKALADRIRGSSTDFVCLDKVLCEAARLEGLIPILA